MKTRTVPTSSAPILSRSSLLAVTTLALGVGACSDAATTKEEVGHAQSAMVQKRAWMTIPAYIPAANQAPYPENWTRMLDSISYENAVIVNGDANGPPTFNNTLLRSYINALQHGENGPVMVLGYVHFIFDRDPQAIVDDVQKWLRNGRSDPNDPNTEGYHTDGIFFDVAHREPGNPTDMGRALYFAKLVQDGPVYSDFGWRYPIPWAMFNWGTSNEVMYQYVDCLTKQSQDLYSSRGNGWEATRFVSAERFHTDYYKANGTPTEEDARWGDSSWWISQFPPDQFVHLVHKTPGVAMSTADINGILSKMTAHNAAGVYVTDNDTGNPWSPLTSGGYFGAPWQTQLNYTSAAINRTYPGTSSPTYHGSYCPGRNTCGHDLCSTGSHLSASCDPCVSQICAQDPFCCNSLWDPICKSEVTSICGSSCP